MKEKILVALKTKYKTFGFGDKAFDGVADYLSKTVTEESQIETVVSGVEGLLKSFQGDIDTVRNEKSGLQRQLEELKGKAGIQTIPQGGGEQQTDMAKIIADAIKTAIEPISIELTGIKQARIQEQRTAQIFAKAKEYGIPETLVPMLKIDEKADLDTYFKEAKQTFVNSGLAEVKTPEAGGAAKTDGESIANMISQGTKEIVESKKND